MYSRDIGVAWVEHQGDADCLEAAAGKLRPILRCRRGEFVAPNMRKSNPSPLKNITSLK
jgi:hypothetical protein